MTRKPLDARRSSETSSASKSALERIEALAAAPADEQTTARLAEAEAEWRALLEDAPAEPAADERARFASATTAVQASVARAAEARARQLELAEQLATVRSSKLALCERVDALRGEDAARRARRPRAANGRGLPAGPSPMRRTPSCSTDSKRRAGARPSVTRTGRRLRAMNSRLEQLSTRGGAARGAGGQPGVRVGGCRARVERSPRSGATGSTKRSGSASPPPMRRSRARARRRGGRRKGAASAGPAARSADRAGAPSAPSAEDLTLRRPTRPRAICAPRIETPPALPHVERE